MTKAERIAQIREDIQAFRENSLQAGSLPMTPDRPLCWLVGFLGGFVGAISLSEWRWIGILFSVGTGVILCLWDLAHEPRRDTR